MNWHEKEFEEKMTTYIDDIYREIFSNVKEIKRSKRDIINPTRINFLDKELGIDTLLIFENGSFLTLQEKTRNFYYYKFQDFTFELYNDPIIKDPGEFFKIAAQLYFYGYANIGQNGYYDFYILYITQLRLFLNNRKFLQNEYIKFNKPPAKANFIVIPFNEIPSNCIFYHKNSLSIEKSQDENVLSFIENKKMTLGDFF